MWGALAAAAVLVAGWSQLAPAPRTEAEPTALLDLFENGQGRVEKVGRTDCLRQAGRLWVAAETGVECISYVTAGPVSGSAFALVFLNGDVPEDRLAKQARVSARAEEQAAADRLSARSGLPVVIVGRPGLMGSTGFHLKGGQRDEALVIDGAIAGLKERYGIRRLAMAGQSGGARNIAQLMVLGNHGLACAAMGSGAYGVPNLKGGGKVRTDIWGDPGKSLLVPLREAGRVQPDTTRRSFVIGDPRDRITPFAEQRAWADQLAAGGHQVVLIEATAKDNDHHGTAAQAITAAALCARGRSDADIAAAVKAL